jgi:hypothetical protein
MVKRIAKAVRDSLAFSAQISLLGDTDRAGQNTPVVGSAAETGGKPDSGDRVVQAGGSRAAKAIGAADALRLRGMDLASEGKQAEAHGHFQRAIQGYLGAWEELIDFSTLADACARAGVAAFLAGLPPATVRDHFAMGLAIQPTLVIDRRVAPKKLLELFDGMVADTQKARRLRIGVEGDAPGGVLFVDGIRIGELPATATNLLPGTHYLQVRSDEYQPWVQAVRLAGRDLKVKARLKPVKRPGEKVKPQLVLTAQDLAVCVDRGAFVDGRCRDLTQRYARQIGAEYVLYTAVTLDRYERPSLLPFLLQAESGRVVAMESISFDANLAELAPRLADFDKTVVTQTRPFPRARALTARPRALISP